MGIPPRLCNIEQFIYINLAYSAMRRPQSAKHGYRNNNIQPSFEDFKEDHANIQKQNRKLHVKLMKPDLTTNDFGRIMPKKIHQDKERLYSEALHLKQNLNEITQENIRLKTRITILEKQKDKMNKYIEASAGEANKANSRLNMYSGGHIKSNNNLGSENKENMMVRNLKKMIRESKQENQYLKQENQKIKKAIKYTRINQLQIERKMLLEENQRINRILVELNEQLADKDDYEQEIQELKNYLEEEVQANRELSESNQKYLEYIQELEDKIKNLEEKKEEKQKKMQRQNGLLKRKNNEFIKINDDLRKELRDFRDKQQLERKKGKPLGRPMSSNPYTKSNLQSNNILGVSSSLNVKQFQQLKTKNQKLEQQLQKMKQKLQKSEIQLHQKSVIKPQQRKKTEENNNKLKTQQRSFKDQYQFEEESHNENNPQFILDEGKKIEKEQFEEYGDDFEKGEKLKDESKMDYDEKFESPAKEQVHQIKQNKEKKSKSNKKEKQKKTYKPDKKVLTEIKQLLTYRMKAQRYPFAELEKDIRNSNQKQFPIPDLKSMMRSQPFYLTQAHTNIFLQYCQQSETINTKKPVNVEIFLQKMQKLIKEFQLMSEEEEQQILLRVAEMTTQYPQELAGAFENIKNGPETVSKDKLIEMFKKLQLANEYIQAIIAELSLCSEDLQHLNFRGFFERFYIQQQGDQYEEQSMGPPPINETNQEQIESSGQQREQVKTNLTSNIPKIVEQEEYQDDKVNFILEDEGELSMGMKNNELPDEQDMVSDDGRI